MRINLNKDDLTTITIPPKYKFRNLFFGLFFDMLGNLSYLIPVLGEGFDIFWAPIAMYLMNKIYPSRVGKIASIFTFIEEVLPGMDFIPSFTIMWFYTYVFKK